MSPAGAAAGDRGRPASIRDAWSSSTRPGSRPTWLRCVDGRPKGDRLRGFAPHGHWRTLTFLGALRCDRLAAPCVFDGPINGECFRAYVEQLLVPCLRPATSSSWTISAATSRRAASHHQGRRRKALVSAALLTRPQSDRAGLRQDQALDARRPETHRRRHSGGTSATSSAQSSPANAATTSPTLDTLPSNRETL